MNTYFKISGILLPIGIVLIIFLLFKKDQNQSIENIEKSLQKALKTTDSTKTILDKQRITIAELEKMNTDLKFKISKVDSINEVMKKKIDSDLNNTKQTIKNLNESIKAIDNIIIH